MCVCVGGGGGSFLFGHMLLIIIYKSFPSQQGRNEVYFFPTDPTFWP